MKKIIPFFLILANHWAKAQIVVNAGWEKGGVLQDKFSPQSFCTPYGASISDSFARRGKHSVRFELRATDTICGYSKRAELFIPSIPSTQNYLWYAWSEYLPADYAFDNVNESHFQLHHTSRTGSPLIGLWITADKWKFVQTFDTADIDNKTKHTIKQYDLGPVSKGEWVDWVLYADFKLDSSGKIKLWKNGRQVLDIDGANFNRENGKPQRKPYIKFGIYKWPWHDKAGPFNPDRRVVYFDEVKLGEAGLTIGDFLLNDNNFYKKGKSKKTSRKKHKAQHK